MSHGKEKWTTPEGTAASPGELAYLLDYERGRFSRLLDLCEENGLVIPPVLLEPPSPYKQVEKETKKGIRKKVKGSRSREQHDLDVIEMMQSLLEEAKERSLHNPIAASLINNVPKTLEELLSNSSRLVVNSHIKKPNPFSGDSKCALAEHPDVEKETTTKGLKKAVGSVSLRTLSEGGEKEDVMALHLACFLPNSTNLVGILLSHGAAIVTPDVPFSPIHVAAVYASVETVQVFFFFFIFLGFIDPSFPSFHCLLSLSSFLSLANTSHHLTNSSSSTTAQISPNPHDSPTSTPTRLHSPSAETVPTATSK